MCLTIDFWINVGWGMMSLFKQCYDFSMLCLFLKICNLILVQAASSCVNEEEKKRAVQKKWIVIKKSNNSIIHVFARGTCLFRAPLFRSHWWPAWWKEHHHDRSSKQNQSRGHPLSLSPQMQISSPVSYFTEKHFSWLSTGARKNLHVINCDAGNCTGIFAKSRDCLVSRGFLKEKRKRKRALACYFF